MTDDVITPGRRAAGLNAAYTAYARSAAAPAPTVRSRFESIARLSTGRFSSAWESAGAEPLGGAPLGGAPLGWGPLGGAPLGWGPLGVLLAATCPGADSECSALRAVWTEEAMHRAYSLMRLAGESTRQHGTRQHGTRQHGTRQHGLGGRPPASAAVEAALAGSLARQFKSLAVGSLVAGRERPMLACSSILRGVVTDMCALFGVAANVVLVTHIERVALPDYKRRALVLAACELVSNSLLHGFPRRSDGRIEVSLLSLGPGRTRLGVADDGSGFAGRVPNLECGIAAGLADVLGAELGYRRTNGWTQAEIVFPAADPAG